MKTYNFTQTKVVGKWAVERLTEYLITRGWYIENVEEDRLYQVLDIDLVAMGPAPRRFIEVKGDRYMTGNIYIETIGNFERGEPGCLVYTGADFIAYYLVRKGTCYMIPVPALKAWIPDNIGRFAEKQVRSSFDSGHSFTSRGRPVPAAVIQAEVPGVSVIEGLPVLEN